MSEEELSDRQKFIGQLNDDICKMVEPLLKQKMKEYIKQYGNTAEDRWLWHAGIDIDLSVAFAVSYPEVTYDESEAKKILDYWEKYFTWLAEQKQVNE